jgi:tetratricopeptide (TPR) repeat protein
MAIKSIKLKSSITRIGLIAAGVIYLVAVFFFAKWCFANSIATRADIKEIAEFSVGLAPGDPQTHYALAVLNEQSFLPEDLLKSLNELETATALSPYDFRLWLALGNARGQNGDAKGAENAFRRALILAPNYAQIHWALGNNLIRQDKMEEGFAEIRLAAQSDPKYIKPTLSTAGLIFDDDLAQIKKNIGDSPEINAELAIYLTGQKNFDEGLEIWNKLSDEEKKTTFREISENLYSEMLQAKRYRNAFQINKQISPDEPKEFAVEKIYNSGFELDVKPKDAGVFEWQLGNGLTPQIAFDDSQKHGGNRSIVILFNSMESKDFRTISQMVIVEAGKTYEFEIFYKSDLKTASTLKWDIFDAGSGKVLVSTEPIAKNTDWTSLKATFKTNEETEAIVIQLARDACISSVCPISGKVWFDDVSIK